MRVVRWVEALIGKLVEWRPGLNPMHVLARSRAAPTVRFTHGFTTIHVPVAIDC